MTRSIDLGEEPTERIIADFRATIGAMKCAMSERLVRLGISMAQLNIMYVLQRNGEMPMSRLADVLNVSLSNASGLVDRMEERGFIERTRVAEDRRVVLVRVTNAGSRVIEENDALSDELMRDVLGRLEPAQLVIIAGAVSDFRSALESRTRLEIIRRELSHHGEHSDGSRRDGSVPDGRSGPRPESPREDGDPVRGPAWPVPRRTRPDDRRSGAADASRPTCRATTCTSGRSRSICSPARSASRSAASSPTCTVASPCFMTGIVIFLFGSALSGLSQNMEHAHPVPRPPGDRRRFALPGRAGRHRRPVHPGRAGQVPGPLRGRLRRRLRGRSAGRRLPDRAGQLALDLLRQHPDRTRLAVRHLSAPAEREAGGDGAQLRHPRWGHLHDRDQLPAGRTDQQAVRRLDRPDRRRIPARRARRDGALHPRGGRARGADHPARPLPEPDLHELDDRDVLRELRVLRCDHLPAALVPVRPRLHRRRTPASLPCP
ncbi:MAG: MarR family transcriptional regulator [Candidatus Limnocylindrales bacterium]